MTYEACRLSSRMTALTRSAAAGCDRMARTAPYPALNDVSVTADHVGRRPVIVAVASAASSSSVAKRAGSANGAA